MKIDFKKILKRKKHFRKGGFHTNPNIGWQILVLFSFGAGLVFFVIGFMQFRELSAQFQTPVFPEEDWEGAMSRERIEKTLQYFSERERKSKDITTSPASIADPSR